MMRRLLLLLGCLTVFSFSAILLQDQALAKPGAPVEQEASVEKAPADEADYDGYVAIIEMEMMILPGTQSFLEKSIHRAEQSGAKLLIVKLNTPGGILQTTQKMIQRIFQSKIPVVVYISPTGGTATSAGVFITMAGHVAVMAPGTTIGSAHPVSGEGKDIEGDMRKKVEEATAALVKSVTEQRGRNIEWVEKAVRESVSLTDKEALEQGVVDFVAPDVTELLKQITGFEVQLETQKVELQDYSKLPRKELQMDLNDEVLNVLANPNIAAILWLAATTGISIELYNPGLIFPGVVGVICLILALAVTQILPLSQVGLLLLILGAVLIASELFVGSGILGVGGIISVILGAMYLIDVVAAPGLEVSKALILPIGVGLGGYLFFVIRGAVMARSIQPFTGSEGMVGKIVEVREPVSVSGKVFVDGEYWDATCSQGIIEAGTNAKVVAMLPGMKLEVAPHKEG
ncbi:MAG: nodulation protein NfeD [Bdellovibrionales bacterium]|nr:nodulation protein NfeD [Bdellovibrionales bacterium]